MLIYEETTPEQAEEIVLTKSLEALANQYFDVNFTVGPGWLQVTGNISAHPDLLREDKIECCLQNKLTLRHADDMELFWGKKTGRDQ